MTPTRRRIFDQTQRKSNNLRLEDWSARDSLAVLLGSERVLELIESVTADHPEMLDQPLSLVARDLVLMPGIGPGTAVLWIAAQVYARKLGQHAEIQDINPEPLGFPLRCHEVSDPHEPHFLLSAPEGMSSSASINSVPSYGTIHSSEATGDLPDPAAERGGCNMSPDLPSRHLRTLDAIFREPTSSSLRWREVASLLKALGAIIDHRPGSSRRASLNGIDLQFHEPHGTAGASLQRGFVRRLRTFLERAGVSPR